MKFRNISWILTAVVFLIFPASPALSEGPWSSEIDMPSARMSHGSVEVGGKIYIIGGIVDAAVTGSVLEYDPSAQTYTPKPTMPTPRSAFACAAIDGKIYVAAGHNGSTRIDTLEVFDPVAQTWTDKAPLPSGLDNPAGCVVNGKLYVIGGCCDFRNTLYEYDPVADTWSAKTVMPTARGCMTASVVDGKIYVIGGRDNTSDDSSRLSTVEVYDPATDTWATAADMPTARRYPVSAATGDRIYVFGGEIGGATYLPTVEVYDPATDTWNTLDPMPVERVAFSGSVFDGKVYIFGGLNASGVLDSAYVYDLFLRAYYPFNGNANDESGNRNNGTPNGIDWLTSQLGTSAQFDGDRSLLQYINCGNLAIPEQFTYSAWIKKDGFNIDNDAMSILVKRDGVSLSNILWFVLDNASGKLVWEQGFGGSTGESLYGVTDLSADNNWHLVTIVYDGSERRLYLDANLEGTKSENRAPTQFDANLYIGLEKDNSNGPQRAWKGLIDNVRIYNRALTAAEIQNLYNQENPSMLEGIISGTVYDSAGAAIKSEQIRVEVFSGDPCGSLQFIQSATTDTSNGTFTITDIPSGTYYLRTDGVQYVNEWWASDSSVIDCNSAQSITVDTGDTFFGTNFHLDIDTDKDGMGDEWEITHFGDLTSHDGNADSDGDGLTDLQEYQYGTNPKNPDSDGDKITDGYEVNQGTSPTDPADTPPIPIAWSIYNVHEADGSLATKILIWIRDSFTGTLPGDIDTITVTGPGGVLPYTKADFTYKTFSNSPQMGLSGCFILSIPGSPALGEYTVNVESGTSQSGIQNDIQTVNRSIPIIDTASFSPADNATVVSKTPHFSWEGIDYSEAPVFYQLMIQDMSGNYIYFTPREKIMMAWTLPVDILNTGQTYKWRVMTADNFDYNRIQNRSFSDWRTFTMAGTLTHNAPPAIDGGSTLGVTTWSTPTPDGSATNLLFWASVTDHDGVASDGSSHTLNVTYPDGNTTIPMYAHTLNSKAYLFQGKQIRTDTKGVLLRLRKPRGEPRDSGELYVHGYRS